MQSPAGLAVLVIEFALPHDHSSPFSDALMKLIAEQNQHGTFRLNLTLSLCSDQISPAGNTTDSHASVYYAHATVDADFEYLVRLVVFSPRQEARMLYMFVEYTNEVGTFPSYLRELTPDRQDRARDKVHVASLENDSKTSTPSNLGSFCAPKHHHLYCVPPTSLLRAARC